MKLIINGPPPVPTGQWFSFVAGKKEEDPHEVYIYGQIGTGWDGRSGIDAKAFAKEWDEIPKKQDIKLRIHSPGGSVFDALAIYNIVNASRDRVTAHIDGVALSAASFIAMAAGKVVMPKTARMMIHDAQGLAIGSSARMREMAELLDRESDNIADMYARKTGETRKKMRGLMQVTTWMDGQKALDLGFVDEVTNLDPKNCEFDLSVFQRVPEDLKNGATKSAAQNGGANNTGDTVNKTAILALLLSHGVKLENSATDETILAELDKLVKAGTVKEDDRKKLVQNGPPPTPAPTPAPAPANVVTLEQFQTLQNQLNVERTQRITAAFDAIVAENPNIDREWLPRVLADETLLANLRKLPGRIVDPSRPSVTNQGNPVIEKYRKLKPGAERMALRVENHEFLLANSQALIPERDFATIRNANSLAAALTPDYLADGLIINARNRLAPLSAFSNNFGINALVPRATVQVARATAGPTAVTNATNFEAGDTTLAAIGVTVNQITVPFHLTNDQINKGHEMRKLSGIAADQLADAISDVWTALLVVGTYGTPGAGTGIIGTSANFDPADLPQLFGLAKNFRRRNLLLDGAYIGALFPGVIASFSSGVGLNQNGANTAFGPVFGFDGIFMQNRYTGAVANSVGFLCGPDAIGVASGLPLTLPGGQNLIATQVVNIDGEASNQPNLGLSIQINSWLSTATRTAWASYDVMFGAAAGDASTTLTLGQGRLLVSA